MAATVIEIVPFRAPGAEAAATRRRRGHPILDAGGTATLVVLIGLYILPFVLFGLSSTARALTGSGFELRMTVYAAMLTLLLPVVQIFVHIRMHGGSTIRGNRESYPLSAGAAGRVARAHANAVESLVPFAIVVLVGHALRIGNAWTVASAALYFAARLMHTASYIAGVTTIRSAAFYAGVAATVVEACQILLWMP